MLNRADTTKGFSASKKRRKYRAEIHWHAEKLGAPKTPRYSNVMKGFANNYSETNNGESLSSTQPNNKKNELPSHRPKAIQRETRNERHHAQTIRYFGSGHYTLRAVFSRSAHAKTYTSELYDTVINGGRVMDPETLTDRVTNLGIRKGQIARITDDAIKGKSTINATGLVVAPGFIDIHSHTPTRHGEHLSVLDGITTQLDLESGSYPPTKYGYQYRGGAQLHYGSSVGHFAIRGLVMEGSSQSYFFDETGFITLGGDMWRRQASPAQVEEMRKHLRNGLELGGLGIGVLLDYMTEAVSESELSMIFATAAEYNKPVYVHVRRGMPGDPTGLDEVIALAEAHGVATMICHITHSAMGVSMNGWQKSMLPMPRRPNHHRNPVLSRRWNIYRRGCVCES